jgi:acyl-CoA thioesterase FadM
MRNATSGDVAAIVMNTAVHLDTVTRKATPFPDEVKAAAHAHVIDFRLPWAA